MSNEPYVYDLYSKNGDDLDLAGKAIGLPRKSTLLSLLSPVFRRWPFQETDNDYRERLQKEQLRQRVDAWFNDAKDYTAGHTTVS